LIRNVAETVILPRFRLPETHEIIEKAPGELATIADREAEIELEAAFRELDPGSDVVGEEAVSTYPQLMDKIVDSKSLWLIDPIDGTNNFIRGSDNFAVMVARLEHGLPTHAWIYQPVTAEMTVAERGSGAWFNGTRLYIPKAPDLAEMTGAAHIGRFPPEIQVRVKAGLASIGKNQPLYCAGLDYVALSRGIKHFSLYSRTLPWDHAPGSLIHQESGGYVARLDGSAYAPAALSPGILSAPNEDVWRQLRQVLFGY
jgi:fructose-1,6-bisphosphatase/inositol monophosphatase family enzyme